MPRPIARSQPLGQKLLNGKVVTKEQIDKALERQRLQGGRLGDNLVALGYLTPEELNCFFMARPPVPGSIDDTGLDPSFVQDLIMKHILFMGEFTLSDVAEKVKLPIPIVDASIQALRQEKFVEVKRAAEYARITYKFTITGPGKSRAAELFEICQYVGPAPVTLDQYREVVEVQTVKNIDVSEETVKKAFSHLVISDDLLKRFGPAMNSGKAIFIYGPPGNGKTTIAEAIGNILPGNVYVPYSILVGGQIISVYDPVNHVQVPVPQEAQGSVDQRWILVRRPVMMTGGELSTKMLDLDFNQISKFYEASLQMKANNGLFIVDDFGRQQIEPHVLLNRWIVPLERRIDFMTLHTGMKFDIPFDQLVIFCTNLEPKRLVDEAFLRRIRYKVKIEYPTEEEFEVIFRRVCDSNGIEFKEDVFQFLVRNYYKRLGIPLCACHPRDLIDHIIDYAHYYHQNPKLTKEAIIFAWENYFVEL